MSWKSKSLGELCDSANGVIQTGPFGSQLKQSEYIDDKAGTPVVMPKDIKAGTVDESEIARISEAKANALSRHMLSAGDIVFPRRGEISKRAYIKEGSKYFCGTGCLKIHIPDADVLNKFLFYYLDQEHVVKWLEGRAIGSTMLNLNTSIMRSVQVKYPDIKTQEWIVNTLSAYDDLIENNKRRITLLEESARQLYKEWFVRFRFPGHEHVKIVDGVPEGWELVTLGDVAVTNASSHKAKRLPEELNYIDIASVSKGNIEEKKSMIAADAPGRARRIAQHGDIIWSNVRPNLKAYALVLRPVENDVFSTGFTVITAERVPFTYLYQFVTTDAFVAYLVNHATGVGYPAVRPADFERAPFLLPKTELTDQFHDTCKASYEQIHRLGEQNKQLAKARDLLLPKLMSGELAV
ncbi:restriction endonuclease subunit S [Idiomarina sp. OT37-5b]|uniref:restriction endonuclease subunit S n=1 Tax=Idiomarina sp. OT37-5b TaxID=2100422 RepID=UPI000CFA264B|nr:restriction endonuclease subunit S [Idiomarina sp. OT37-5b]AVJ56734.1 restriction endonuclease subunit S [Idiomarina sp. OT37-5b]